MPPEPDNLYERLMGPAWHNVTASVRSAHSPGGEKRGVFQISHGKSRLARILARWSRLPRPALSAETRLKIVEDGDRQSWERSFDGVPFATTQWAGNAGCLMERVGLWEFCFRLRVENGALGYEQTRVRFCLGPLRLPLPLSPRVAASETPDGLARVRISVQVRLPLFGRLIDYDGWLDVEVPVL